MFYEKQQLQKLSRDAKFELICARREAGLTQAQVAVHLGIPPKTYEAWENTDNERQPHACIILALPPVMGERWLQFFARELGGSFVKDISIVKLNGDLRDEAEQIVIALGRAIDHLKKDSSSDDFSRSKQKRKALQFYDKIIDAARQAKAEIERM